ncbi:hypothetical protein ERJ75_000730400 [Trypanosoma vivax]|uniref:Autophagy-related protein 27 n=1 Tax=Trypanosoma vivax (strain Y486) TaxID=1055687 RepID=G0TX60_TRYVY|nr:hypothetical protein ERJ75_000730400 [Trypanosoma vivax]CCC48550.1 conserved hypothetical protein [Trypanosoma vivax Y486]
MLRVSVNVVALLVAALVLLGMVAETADKSVVPLCGEVRGFAGEHNDHIFIEVPLTPAAGEAIILVVRPFPVSPGELSQRWIQFNATYRLHEGAMSSSLSDSNGLLVLPSVEGGTRIEVKVKRVRTDGPVPFRLWSYHANRPACHIDVSADNSFISLVATRLNAVTGSARVYFKSVAPQGAKGVMITIGETLSPGAPDLGKHFQTMSSPEQQAGEDRKSGVVFPWSSGVLYFVFNPGATTASSMPLNVGVAWTSDADGTVGDSAPGAGSIGHPNETAGAQGVPVTSSESKGHSFLYYFFIFFGVGMIYVVVMSVFNYRQRGVTEFPEMLPHIDSLRACTTYVSLLYDSFRQGNSRGGYRDIGGGEMRTDTI